MRNTLPRGTVRARRDRPVMLRAGRMHRAFARLAAALPERAVGVLNAFAFLSLGAALLALLLL